jgi:hypothetical protein
VFDAAIQILWPAWSMRDEPTAAELLLWRAEARAFVAKFIGEVADAT